MTPRLFTTLFSLAFLVPAACGGEDAVQPAGAVAGSGAGSGGGAQAVVPASLFVATAPAGAVSVRDALASAKKGDEIVVQAVVGGRKKAFVDGRAVFVAIDRSMKHCPDDEGCPTPWDYCCDTQETLLANTMTVQVVGADGGPIDGSLSGVHGLNELDKIIIAGTVSTADGTLVLDAKSIHIEG